MGCPLGNENARAFGIPNELAVKVDLKLPLRHETYLAHFAPVRLDKLRRKFGDAHLSLTISEHLDSDTGHRRLPRQRIKFYFVRFHSSGSCRATITPGVQTRCTALKRLGMRLLYVRSVRHIRDGFHLDLAIHTIYSSYELKIPPLPLRNQKCPSHLRKLLHGHRPFAK